MPHFYVVTNASTLRDERMCELFTFKARRAGDKLRKGISRMLIAVGSQRNERFHFSNCSQPPPNAVPVFAAPCLRGKSYLHRIHERHVHDLEKFILARPNALCNALQPPDGMRRGVCRIIRLREEFFAQRL